MKTKLKLKKCNFFRKNPIARSEKQVSLDVSHKIGILNIMEKLDRIAKLNTEMLAVLTLLIRDENYTELKHQLLDSALQRLLNNSESINQELLN